MIITNLQITGSVRESQYPFKLDFFDPILNDFSNRETCFPEVSFPERRLPCFYAEIMNCRSWNVDIPGTAVSSLSSTDKDVSEKLHLSMSLYRLLKNRDQFRLLNQVYFQIVTASLRQAPPDGICLSDLSGSAYEQGFF